MNIKELRQRHADLVATGKALFKVAEDAKRGLSDEEKKADDKIQADLEQVGEDIKRAERNMDRERNLPGKSVGNDDPADPKNPAKRFASFGEQMAAVMTAGLGHGNIDPRLSAGPTGLGEAIGSDGGFLVQKDFNDELLRQTYEGGEIVKRVRRIPISANANGLKINSIDETDRANGSRWGGVRAYWTAEAAAMTATKPKFREIQLNLNKLTGLCYATEELLRDTIALGAVLNQAFSEEFVFKIEDAAMNGAGAGMPLGYLNGGGVVSVAKETSQAAATILSPNITKMWARMPARNRANAVWLVNQDAEPQLFTLNVAVKNVAGSENVGGFRSPDVVYMPPGFNGNQFGLMMGRPVVPVEYCATIGTVGDIQLVDLSQYLMIDKGAMESASSIHVQFLANETTFRFIYRADGQPIWNSAVTPFKGSNTQSPYITLATRA